MKDVRLHLDLHMKLTQLGTLSDQELLRQLSFWWFEQMQQLLPQIRAASYSNGILEVKNKPSD